MKTCPNCNKANASNRRSCLFCGGPFIKVESKGKIGPLVTKDDDVDKLVVLAAGGKEKPNFDVPPLGVRPSLPHAVIGALIITFVALAALVVVYLITASE